MKVGSIWWRVEILGITQSNKTYIDCAANLHCAGLCCNVVIMALEEIIKLNVIELLHDAAREIKKKKDLNPNCGKVPVYDIEIIFNFTDLKITIAQLNNFCTFLIETL